MFLLFAGTNCYPNGGAYDFQGAFGSLPQAIGSMIITNFKENSRWANVFDTERLRVVAVFEESEGWRLSDGTIANMSQIGTFK